MKAATSRSLPLALIFITSSCLPGSDEAAPERAGGLEEAVALEGDVAPLIVNPPDSIADKCPANVCGMNSADLTDWWSHELNLDERANGEGYSLESVRKGAAYYTLKVEAGRITATLSFGAVDAPRTLSGYALAGTELRIKRVVDGVTSHRSIIIDAVSRTTDYWAKRPDGTPTPKIETYKFRMRLDNGYGAFLCQNGALLADPSSPVRAMPEHHALVFEGERIDVEGLTVGSQLDTRWFNFGCAETALAKLHLTGHTKAAYYDAGFVTSLAERQTMLKMLTADYCGTGNSFTVSGQPLRWTDDRGTMTLSPGFGKVLEARWTPAGAACLNTPRVDAHPSDASRARFEYGAAFEIAHECFLPACGATSTSYHLLSWNPTPFTN
jgi:hypothetical protein